MYEGTTLSVVSLKMADYMGWEENSVIGYHFPTWKSIFLITQQQKEKQIIFQLNWIVLFLSLIYHIPTNQTPQIRPPLLLFLSHRSVLTYTWGWRINFQYKYLRILINQIAHYYHIAILPSFMKAKAPSDPSKRANGNCEKGCWCWENMAKVKI